MTAAHVSPATADRARTTRAVGVWVVSLAGIGSIALTMGLTMAGAVAADPEWGSLTLGLYLIADASFALVGAVLVTRVPDNRVGWILWTAGATLAIGVVGHAAAVTAFVSDGPSPPSVFLALLAVACIQVTFALIMAFLPLLYPTGRPPSPRWRPVVWYAVIVAAFSVAKEVLAPGPLDPVSGVENPLVFDAFAADWDAVNIVQSIMLLTLIPLSVLSLVARYRAAALVERQQVKWFAAIALLMVAFFAGAILAPTEELANLGWGLAILMLPLLPVAIGVAVLRYRLYEIDRLISRTIGWTLVTGLLLTLFTAMILATQALLATFTQGQTIAVAASTLAIFALFQPLRRRVQRAVDRRFDRARFDTERLAAAFADRLRADLDIDSVADDLTQTTSAAVAPTSLGIWLRQKEAAR